jgi:hypothetical protein
VCYERGENGIVRQEQVQASFAFQCRLQQVEQSSYRMRGWVHAGQRLRGCHQMGDDAVIAQPLPILPRHIPVGDEGTWCA